MARINLNIEAENGYELLKALKDILEGKHVDRPTPYFAHPPLDDEPEEQPTAASTQDAEPGERTRFKRTRDEIARGLTVEQAKAERAGNVTPSASTPTNTSSESPASTSPSTGPVDPFAEPPTTPTASPTTSDASQGRALTLQDLRSAMSAYLAKNDDAGAMQSLMAAHFKTEEGEPVMRASQLQTKDYAAAIELLSA